MKFVVADDSQLHCNTSVIPYADTDALHCDCEQEIYSVLIFLALFPFYIGQ